MITEAGSRIRLGLGLTLAFLLCAGPSAGQPAPAAPGDFGTVSSGYSAYNGDQFHGLSSTFAYSCGMCIGEIFNTGGANAASVQLQMPSGSSFKVLRWWAFDDDPGDLSFIVSKTCLPAFGAGPPVLTPLANGSSSGTPGDASGGIIIPGVETVDNEACTYKVTVFWENTGNTLQLHKVRAQWERQVSPAPAVATFGDVPTDHPFFQFVEALSASSITAGCNAAPPLYCPDAPLTRGQMAVFLSKALGLHWP